MSKIKNRKGCILVIILTVVIIIGFVLSAYYFVFHKKTVVFSSETYAGNTLTVYKVGLNLFNYYMLVEIDGEDIFNFELNVGLASFSEPECIQNDDSGYCFDLYVEKWLIVFCFDADFTTLDWYALSGSGNYFDPAEKNYKINMVTDSIEFLGYIQE